MSNINLYIIGSAPFEDRIQTPNMNDIDILYNIIFKNNNLIIYLFDPNYKNNISTEIEHFNIYSTYFEEYLSKNPLNEKDFYIIIDFIGNTNIIDLFHSYKIIFNKNIIYIPCKCFQNQFSYSLLLKPFIINDNSNIEFLQYNFFKLINLNTYTIDSIQNIFILNYKKIYFDIYNLIDNNNLLEGDFYSNIYLNHDNYSLQLNECIKIHDSYIINTFETIKNHILIITSVIKYIYINIYFNKSYENYGIYMSYKYLFDLIKNDVNYYYILLLNLLDLNDIRVFTPLCKNHPICKELFYEYCESENDVSINNKHICIMEGYESSMSEISSNDTLLDSYFFNITKSINSYFNLFCKQTCDVLK